MELTINLPARDWYRNTTDNDLLYWGLDYPPLTAYHSWLCGKIGHMIEPESMHLHSSRGYETPSSKLFMRTAALVAECLVFIPAVCAFVVTHHSARPKEEKGAALMLILLQPALILIDHGHFQFNSVALGFTVAAVVALSWQHPLADFVGSILFVLALNYKQMSLYYALPFFFYILGKAVAGPRPVGKVALVACVVIGSMALCWAPFLYSVDGALTVLTRLFPFNRGLYEDKVANFWGATSLVLKWKQWFPKPVLVKMSLGATVTGLLPSCVNLFRFPTQQRFLYSLACSALSFYLFSFQVHEKTILFPLLPILLLSFELGPFLVAWFSLVCTFSMYPLLVRDGLALAYFAMMIMFSLIGLVLGKPEPRWLNLPCKVSFLGMSVIHMIAAVKDPPARYPDLFTYMFVGWSFLHIFFALIILSWLQLSILRPEKKKAS